jgi:hypothetical protein
MAQPTLLRTASKAHDFTSPGTLAVDLTGAHAIIVQAFQDSTADATFGFTGCSISGSGLSFTAGTEVTWNTTASKRRAFWLTSNSIPSGTQTINVTWTGSRRGGFVVYVFNDAGASPSITIVDSTPIATTGSSPATQSFTVTSTTSSASCLAFVTACNFQAFSGTLPATGNSGTTAVGYDNTSLVWQAWFSKNGAATSTTLDWTWSTTGNNLSLFGFSITGSTAGPVLTGDCPVADMVLSGAFATGALSQLASGILMDDFILGGVLGLAPGIIVTSPFKNWSGTLLPGITVPNVVFIKLDRTQTLALVNQTTAGDGVMTITNAALVTGTYYIMVSFNTDGTSIGAELVRAV